MAFITKWKCYRGKIDAKIFWFKKLLHAMKVHFQMRQGQLCNQNLLKMKVNWDHSHLCPKFPLVPQKYSPEREKSPLGLCGNPVTFLLQPSQKTQDTAETDSAAAFCGAGRSFSGIAPCPPAARPVLRAPGSGRSRQRNKTMIFSSEGSCQNTALIYSSQLLLSICLWKATTPLQLHTERHFQPFS